MLQETQKHTDTAQVEQLKLHVKEDEHSAKLQGHTAWKNIRILGIVLQAA